MYAWSTYKEAEKSASVGIWWRVVYFIIFITGYYKTTRSLLYQQPLKIYETETPFPVLPDSNPIYSGVCNYIHKLKSESPRGDILKLSWHVSPLDWEVRCR